MIIKIYGHAGQGVDMARKVIGDACLASGFFVQDAIISGMERRKQDVSGYVRFEKNEIITKQLKNPDISLVFDMIFEKQSITETNENGIIIFNAPEGVKSPAVKKKRIKCFYVDANDIIMRILSKKPIPNMAMLGAFAKAFDKVSMKNVKNAILNELGENKEANMEFDEGYKNVKRC